MTDTYEGRLTDAARSALNREAALGRAILEHLLTDDADRHIDQLRGDPDATDWLDKLADLIMRYELAQSHRLEALDQLERASRA